MAHGKPQRRRDQERRTLGVVARDFSIPTPTPGCFGSAVTSHVHNGETEKQRRTELSAFVTCESAAGRRRRPDRAKRARYKPLKTTQRRLVSGPLHAIGDSPLRGPSAALHINRNRSALRVSVPQLLCVDRVSADECRQTTRPTRQDPGSTSRNSWRHGGLACDFWLAWLRQRERVDRVPSRDRDVLLAIHRVADR